MKTQENFTAAQTFGLLLVGPPKSGKTNVAMCFPDPYVLDCDMNLQSAVQRHPGKKFFYDCPDLDEAGKELPREKKWLRLVELTKANMLSPLTKANVVDSLSKVSEYLCDYLVDKGATGKDLSIGGEKMMTLQLWYPYKVLFTRYIAMLRSCGKPLVMCAHEKIDKDEVSGTLMYRPNVSGGLVDNIGMYFTDVWRCEVDKIGNEYKYYVRTMPIPRVQSLGNSLGLPETFVMTPDELKKHLKI